MPESIGEMLASFDEIEAGILGKREEEPQVVETPEVVVPDENTDNEVVDLFDTMEDNDQQQQVETLEQPEQSEQVESTEEDPIETLRQQNDLLRQQMEYLAGLQLKAGVPGVSPAPSPAQTPSHPQPAGSPPSPGLWSSGAAAQSPTPQPQPTVQFTTGQMEQILSDPNVFSQFVAQIQEEAVQRAVERALKDVGSIVHQTVSHQVSVSAMVSSFFRDNKDLLPYRNQVGIIANELLAQNPGMPYSQLFAQVNTEARKRLAPLLNGAKTRQTSRPSFAGRQSTVRKVEPAPQLPPLQQEIMDLMAL